MRGEPSVYILLLTAAVLILFKLALIAAVIYVVWHFVEKYW